jgi:hypothetical protein
MSENLRRLGYRGLLAFLLLPAALPAQAEELAGLPASVLSDHELTGARGGDGLNLVQLSELSENATLSGNTVNGAITGNNMISDGAFAGTNGFATVIQNSGNHVIIQDALILNLTFAQ